MKIKCFSNGFCNKRQNIWDNFVIPNNIVNIYGYYGNISAKNCGKNYSNLSAAQIITVNI